MARVLVLGGGFGGVATAYRLRELLSSEHEIVLIDQRDYFMVGFRKSWALTGRINMEDGQRPLSKLQDLGIRIIQDTIEQIDPDSLSVQLGNQSLEGDAMVVALGANLSPEKIPGFESRAYNVYAAHDIHRTAEALQSFQGGQVVVGIFGAPYKCPPAPYEIAIQVNDFFQSRGVDANVEIFTPKPMSLPVLGTAGCGIIEGRLADYGIRFLPIHTATTVEDGEIVFTTERRPFDLLLGIPPHSCPDVVVECGLAEKDGWVKVNPRTLETEFPGVYAIGDVAHVPMANGKPLPKAGIFAEGEGETVAGRIAATISGEAPQSTFDGYGGCFLEVGNDQVMMVEGNFLAEPKPDVSLSEPSKKYMEDKIAFETDRLGKWFS